MDLLALDLEHAAADLSNQSLSSLLKLASRIDRVSSDQLSCKESVLKAAMKVLDKCDFMVESQGMFSSNEEADDITTSHLPLLLIPYLQGQLLSNAPSPNPSARLHMVTAALQCQLKFLHRLDQYKLLGDVASRLFSTEEQGGVRGLHLDPATKRQAKIEMFKQEKLINSQLQQLRLRSGAGTHQVRHHFE
jgi:hypothetical protein